MKIDKKLIKELKDYLEEFDLSEIEYQDGDKKVKVAAADVTTKPSTKDRVKVNNVVLEIVDIRTTELEGKDITYEIYCRG